MFSHISVVIEEAKKNPLSIWFQKHDDLILAHPEADEFNKVDALLPKVVYHFLSDEPNTAKRVVPMSARLIAGNGTDKVFEVDLAFIMPEPGFYLIKRAVKVSLLDPTAKFNIETATAHLLAAEHLEEIEYLMLNEELSRDASVESFVVPGSNKVQ